MGVWYSKDSGFQLIAYADANHAGCNDDCKSTSRGIQFLRDKLVSCAIVISCNPIQHSRTKHINIRYHFIMEHVEKVFHMAQHVISASQLVPQYKPIRRCNNYAVLQSIPCSPECKIRTVSKVPDTEDTIKFLLDTEQFIYIVDMFRDTLQLPVETPKNLFVAPANIHNIEAFMNIVGYQDVVNKVSDFFSKNLAQPWQTMFKVFNRCLTTRTSGYDQTKIDILQLFHAKFPNIPKRIEEDYHYIKDDVPLVTEIRETNDFKEYEMVFLKIKKRKQTARESNSPRRIIKKKTQPTPLIPPLGDDRERDAIAEATLLNEEEIDNIVEGNRDEESYASGFSDSILNDEGADVDDTRSSQEIRNEQKQTPIPSPIRSPRNASFLEKTVSEDLTDNISPTTATTSMTSFTTKYKKRYFTVKTRNLPGSIVGMGRRRNQICSHIKNKFITREFFAEKIQEVLKHNDTIVPELTVAKTNEMIKKEMPYLVKLTVDKDREFFPVDISGMVSKEFAAHEPKLIEELFRKYIQNTTLNLYPQTSPSTATTSSVDLQQQLYLNMKAKPQDQAADLEIWEILKAKFEKP
ncbi:retrovirus-related pol polyprotein from transposon TNT 1-94 [Tanacetum coccineum]